jgi:flagellar hook-associated protein 2
MNVSRLRFSGLSGIDTDSIIKQLMQAERQPIYKMKKNKQLLEWKRDDYREVNNALLELQNIVRDLRYSAAYNKKSVSSSNETVAKVSAGTSAMNGSYTLIVKELASGASITSAQLPSFPLDSDKYFMLNDVEIKINKDDKVEDIVNTINSAVSSKGVKVNYDSAQNRLFFMTTQSGGDQYIEFKQSANDSTGDDIIWLKSNILGPDTSSKVTGKDAEIELNGTKMYFKSNSFSINNLTVELKSRGETNLSVSNDVDGIFDNIKKFIDKYNEVIGKINDKISEKRNYKIIFPTDEEKEKLTDKQYELWESNAKKGMLEGDPLITKYLTQFRTDLSTPLLSAADDLDSIFDIGLDTGNWKEKGKIVIKDEAKLKAAIANDPEKVMNLFIALPDNPNDPDKYKNTGLAQRLYDSLNLAINDLTERIGKDYDGSGKTSLSRQINDWTRKIEEFEKKMVTVENRYIIQFSKLESALQKANAQSSWLYNQSQ